MFSTLLAMALVLAPHTANAKIPSGLTPQLLVSIANDKDNKVSTLHILLDSQQRVAGLYSQGGSNPDQAHFLKDYEKKEGVPLVERDTSIGRITFIRLRGKIDRETQEGKGQAIYVTNALFGSESYCAFEIRKRDGKWSIVNSDTRKIVTKLMIRTSTLGVDKIEGLCNPKN